MPIADPAELTVSQVAERAGVAGSAVRFYEAHGLISSVRTAGNQRRFGPDAACRVRVARVAQRLGLTIAEISAVLADLPGEPTPEDWGRVHAALVAEGEARMAALRAELDGLVSGELLCRL